MELDRVAASIEKFGTVSVSGTTLIEPDPRFQLDLELTGNQIFERNRIEGFSNLSQIDAADVEVSVKAQIVSDMIDQMEATADPALFAQLKNQLMAVAFKGLVANLPEHLRPAFESVLEPTPTTGEPKDAASDGGDALLGLAETKLEEAKDALKQAEEIKGKMGSMGASDTDAASSQVVAAGREALEASKAAAEAAYDAAVEALDMANSAEIALSKQPPGSGAKSQEALDLVTKARNQAKAAQKAAEEARKKLATTLDSYDTEINGESDATAKANKAVNLAKPMLAAGDDTNKTVPYVVEQAKLAVNKGRQAAVMGGVEVAKSGSAPKKRELLTAEPIDPKRRLALKRLPEFKPSLPNFEGDLDLNLRQLLILTASDKITLEMLRWLSYPRGFGPGKRVFLCMASVNVVPGRVTYDGYMGQVDVEMGYAKVERSGEIKSAFDAAGASAVPDARPISFAVFPFIDSQVMDLRTSRRRAFTLALQLVANGYTQAANALLDFAQQREQDVETLSGFNTVSSYSNGICLPPFSVMY